MASHCTLEQSSSSMWAIGIIEARAPTRIPCRFEHCEITPTSPRRGARRAWVQ